MKKLNTFVSIFFFIGVPFFLHASQPIAYERVDSLIGQSRDRISRLGYDVEHKGISNGNLDGRNRFSKTIAFDPESSNIYLLLSSAPADGAMNWIIMDAMVIKNYPKSNRTSTSLCRCKGLNGSDYYPIVDKTHPHGLPGVRIKGYFYFDCSLAKIFYVKKVKRCHLITL